MTERSKSAKHSEANIWSKMQRFAKLMRPTQIKSLYIDRIYVLSHVSLSTLKCLNVEELDNLVVENVAPLICKAFSAGEM